MEILFLLVSLAIGLGLSPWALSRLGRRLGAARPGLGWSALAIILGILVTVGILGAGFFFDQLLISAILAPIVAGLAMGLLVGLAPGWAILVNCLVLIGSLAVSGLLFVGISLIYGVDDLQVFYRQLSGAAPTPAAVDSGQIPGNGAAALKAQADAICDCQAEQSACLSERYETFLATLDGFDEATLSDEDLDTVDRAQSLATQCFFQPGG